jgi:glycine cleavage system H protein
MNPDNLLYNEEHTWLEMISQTQGRVGITNYAQEQLKEVVYIDLPEVGAEVVHMDPFGVIESVKATNDLFSPVTGTVVSVNEEMRANPGMVNGDPYGKGWMIVVELSDPSEKAKLWSKEQYEEFIGK